MRIQRIICLLVGLLLAFTPAFSEESADTLIHATGNWLKYSSSGTRTELAALMDEHCLITTPAGDVLPKERLIPADVNRPVQKLQSMDLEGPTARVFGETGIVMSRLRPAEGPALNGTFVFARQKGAWKLVAIQLSPRRS